MEKLHLTVNDRTLCGLVTVDQLDVYSDEAARRAWNSGGARAMRVMRCRAPGTDSPSARTGPRASDRQAGHGEHPEPAQAEQPIHEQRA